MQRHSYGILTLTTIATRLLCWTMLSFSVHTVPKTIPIWVYGTSLLIDNSLDSLNFLVQILKNCIGLVHKSWFFFLWCSQLWLRSSVSTCFRFNLHGMVALQEGSVIPMERLGYVTLNPCGCDSTYLLDGGKRPKRLSHLVLRVRVLITKKLEWEAEQPGLERDPGTWVVGALAWCRNYFTQFPPHRSGFKSHTLLCQTVASTDFFHVQIN